MAKTISTGFISDTINGIKVNTSKPCSSTNYNSYTSRNVSYIVMHYTGNSKDTAYANANFFQGKNRGASAHFFVDDNNIYQSIALKNLAWHCGGVKTYAHAKCRNANSFGIEMCCTAGNYKISQKTIKNAAYLCANLCKRLGITAENVDVFVLRHYDVTHKNCPAQMSDGGKGDADWIAFKDLVKSILGGVQTPSTPKPSTTPVKPAKEIYRVRKTWADTASQIGAYSVLKNAQEACDKAGSVYEVYNSAGKVVYPVKKFTAYTVMVNTPVLRIRKGPGTNYKHVGNVKKNEVYTIVDKSGSWGKLKSGAGWIHLGYTKKR